MTTDGHKAYMEAVEGAFGADVDYAQLIKIYGSAPDNKKGGYSPAECTGEKKRTVEGDPAYEDINTSFVERQNLTMSMRCFIRLTNGFSKKIDDHIHMLSLYCVHHNFCRIHKSLKVTPAMASGVSDTLHDIKWIVEFVNARAPKSGKRGPYMKDNSN